MCWPLYKGNNSVTNGLQTLLALAVVLFHTPVTNTYWILIVENDLKNIFTFISQLGTFNWNFYNQLLNFLKSAGLSSWNLFQGFFKRKNKVWKQAESPPSLQPYRFLSSPLLALGEGNSISRGESPPQHCLIQSPFKVGEPLPWLQWVSEYVHNTKKLTLLLIFWSTYSIRWVTFMFTDLFISALRRPGDKSLGHGVEKWSLRLKVQVDQKLSAIVRIVHLLITSPAFDVHTDFAI